MAKTMRRRKNIILLVAVHRVLNHELNCQIDTRSRNLGYLAGDVKKWRSLASKHWIMAMKATNRTFVWPHLLTTPRYIGHTLFRLCMFQLVVGNGHILKYMQSDVLLWWWRKLCKAHRGSYVLYRALFMFVYWLYVYMHLPLSIDVLISPISSLPLSLLSLFLPPSLSPSPYFSRYLRYVHWQTRGYESCTVRFLSYLLSKGTHVHE